ncbi:MAG: type II toxin-antitoxin system VapC family toxin [Candidatus Eremiobacteraeota bacterium]|nr:type II toxin-antitoxin system VapC family toxin [Candidatus Eremiobacteraeota bacterium]MCW5866945.1 type II toxin-antitoxin system VapC family toxin [Candidatus Eremiobacteraeota bacterium]
MILADTDVLIDALHGKEPSASRISLELASGRLATTSVTAFELLSGARRPLQRQRIDALLAAMVILPLDRDAANRAASIRLQLEAEGNPIGTADYLVAGIALEHKAILLTRNRGYFERVAGLSLGTLA